MRQVMRGIISSELLMCSGVVRSILFVVVTVAMFVV